MPTHDRTPRQEHQEQIDLALRLRKLPRSEQLKAQWFHYRPSLNLMLEVPMILDLRTVEIVDDDLIIELTEVQYRRVQYGSKVVIEADGIIVETLYDGGQS